MLTKHLHGSPDMRLFLPHPTLYHSARWIWRYDDDRDKVEKDGRRAEIELIEQSLGDVLLLCDDAPPVR